MSRTARLMVSGEMRATLRSSDSLHEPATGTSKPCSRTSARMASATESM